MSEPEPPSDRGAFAGAWNAYVDAAAGKTEWPGDEWGDAELWRAWYARLLEPLAPQGWRRAVEIGQGTGKYTGMVLAAGAGEILACDVAEGFLDLCGRRLAEHVESGRLHLRRIDERDPDALQDAVAELGWTGEVDAVFSIDTFVHLTFTHVVCYMLAATEVLRPGGHLVFTFADATSAAGRQKLIADVDRVVRDAGDPCTGCFHWVSPEQVRATAAAIGFEVALCEVDPLHGRDGQLVARLADPELARAAVRIRRTSGNAQ